MSISNLEAYENRGSLYYILSYTNLIEGLLGIIFTYMIINSSIRLIWKNKSSHLKICFGILVSDFIYSLAIIIMGIAAIINGEYLPTHAWFCGFTDIFFVGGTYLSTWYVALISLERSLLIIHNIRLPTCLWIGIMVFELVMFLIFNIMSISLSQISLANLAVYCMTTPDFPIGYITNTAYFVMMCLCLLIVLYSYIGIAAIQRKKAWKDIRDLNMSKDETLKQANKVIGKVFFLLFIYMACNLTEILNTMYELISGETRSSVADFASTVMLNINPIANCIILIQFHDPIKISLLESYPILSNVFGKQDSENVQTQSVFSSFQLGHS